MIRRVLFLGLVCVACSSKGEPKAEVSDRTVPVGSAPMNLDKPDEARVQLDLAQVRGAVQQSKQLNGAAPKSISEMGLKLFYESDLEYDPTSGLVRSKTYPRY